MNSLEIFSGAGGLAKGLENSGFRHTAFVELNKHACNTLRYNFNPNIVYECGVQEFDLTTLGEVDVIAGGPPCQPFSLAGKHRASEDSRDMFPFAASYIRQLRPKAFIFENVKGLLRNSFSKYFQYILARLTVPSLENFEGENWESHLSRIQDSIANVSHLAEYDVSWSLINAADFGVPQTRERVFIVGTRRDLNLDWSFPLRTHSEDRLNWDKYVTGSYYVKHGISPVSDERIARKLHDKYGMFPPNEKPWRTVRDALNGVPSPTSNGNFSDHLHRAGAKTYVGHTGSFIDEPAKTIKAGVHGVPGGENMIRFEDGSVRYFTIFEAKLLQTFPRDFVFSGEWSEAMRQIGNAVPVKLAEKLASILYALLEQHENTNNAPEVFYPNNRPPSASANRSVMPDT